MKGWTEFSNGTGGIGSIPGARCASSPNRNFRGRHGRGARTHLMSLGMVAATAVAGQITDVRTLVAAKVAGWQIHHGQALARKNIDTGQLIPPRFMSVPRDQGSDCPARRRRGRQLCPPAGIVLRP